MRQAVIYARVSSKEQEREGFSVPAQLKLLKEYANLKLFQIIAEFTDVETAKSSGRENFGKMISFLESRQEKIILAEKTDRLFRNFRDYVTVDDLQIEIHFVKEGSILSRETRSHDKFIHEIKLVMAKNFIDNLREETQKGMREKAEQGIWPSTAPRGYRNILQTDGKRGILPDPDRAREIIDLFQNYATGNYSLRSLPRPDWAYPQVLKKIFDNPFYFGEFYWKGKRYQGLHDPLISKQLWEQCQNVLKGHSRRTRSPRKAFPFTDFITCSCGGRLVGRMQKGRYIYYKCRNPLSVCPEPYIRQEELESAFTEAVCSLQFNKKIADEIRQALIDSASGEKEFRESKIKKLRSEYDRLQKRIETAYIDKLDNRIDSDMFFRMSAEWRTRQDQVNAELSGFEKANRIFIDEGVAILELCQRAGTLFEVQTPIEKRRLLEVMCLNSRLSSQVLEIEWRKPFDELHSTALSIKASPRGQRCNFSPLISALLYPDFESIETYRRVLAA